MTRIYASGFLNNEAYNISNSSCNSPSGEKISLSTSAVMLVHTTKITPFWLVNQRNVVKKLTFRWFTNQIFILIVILCPSEFTVKHKTINPKITIKTITLINKT